MILEIQIPGLGHAKKCGGIKGGIKVVNGIPTLYKFVKKHCLN